MLEKMGRLSKSLVLIYVMVFAMMVPCISLKQVKSISYYFGGDVEQQLPGNPYPENFCSYPNVVDWILRVRGIKITIWPGTGKIDARMSFDMWARFGGAGILEQRLWADSYEDDPVEKKTTQLFVAFTKTSPDFTNQLIIPLSVYTGSIWDDNGYSADFRFDFQYVGPGGPQYKYCVFAVYFARVGYSYLPLNQDLVPLVLHKTICI